MHISVNEYADAVWRWAEQCHSVPSPLVGQGYRMWKFQGRIHGLGRRDMRASMPTRRIGSRTDRNRNENGASVRWAHSTRNGFLRTYFFHMRFPCPTRGEGTVRHAPSQLTECVR